jgi:hypothetical protein
MAAVLRIVTCPLQFENLSQIGHLAHSIVLLKLMFIYLHTSDKVYNSISATNKL